jgi:hypothetical protein
MAGYRKKLIEVALPLDAINAAAAREKSMRHGHPSTLHLWWTQRPPGAKSLGCSSYGGEEGTRRRGPEI